MDRWVCIVNNGRMDWRIDECVLSVCIGSVYWKYMLEMYIGSFIENKYGSVYWKCVLAVCIQMCILSVYWHCVAVYITRLSYSLFPSAAGATKNTAQFWLGSKTPQHIDRESSEEEGVDSCMSWQLYEQTVIWVDSYVSRQLYA